MTRKPRIDTSTLTTFEDTLAAILNTHRNLILQQDREHPNLQRHETHDPNLGDAMQTARITVFELWTQTGGDPQKTIAQFASAYRHKIIDEDRNTSAITVSARQRTKYAKRDTRYIFPEDETTIRQALNWSTFSDITHQHRGNDCDLTDTEILDNLMHAAHGHNDLVTEGARELAEQALDALTPFEREVTRRYYMESDPRTGATDAAVAEELTEDSHRLYGEHQRFTRQFVQRTRSNALKKMRATLGVTTPNKPA